MLGQYWRTIAVARFSLSKMLVNGHDKDAKGRGNPALALQNAKGSKETRKKREEKTEQQSKARRNAKESNRFERGKIKGGKSCPGAPQSINLLFKGGTADAVAGNGRSRTDWREGGKRKKELRG